jgi:hypothetical protein
MAFLLLKKKSQNANSLWDKELGEGNVKNRNVMRNTPKICLKILKNILQKIKNIND